MAKKNETPSPRRRFDTSRQQVRPPPVSLCTHTLWARVLIWLLRLLLLLLSLTLLVVVRIECCCLIDPSINVWLTLWLRRRVWSLFMKVLVIY